MGDVRGVLSAVAGSSYFGSWLVALASAATTLPKSSAAEAAAVLGSLSACVRCSGSAATTSLLSEPPPKAVKARDAAPPKANRRHLQKSGFFIRHLLEAGQSHTPIEDVR